LKFGGTDQRIETDEIHPEVPARLQCHLGRDSYSVL
jgi:hypothetical protein